MESPWKDNACALCERSSDGSLLDCLKEGLCIDSIHNSTPRKVSLRLKKMYLQLKMNM